MNIPLFGPVPPDNELYVHRGLDDEILRALARNEYINLRGGRQTGKTSTIMKLRRLLAKQNTASIYVDLSPIGEIKSDPSHWFELFGQAVLASVIPRESSVNVPSSPTNSAQFPEYIFGIVKAVKPNGMLVIFIDEVSAVPESLQYPLFSTIRAMFNQRTDSGAPDEAQRVLFVFAGSFDPGKIIKGNNSPFNVARDFDTGNYDFSNSQTNELIEKAGISVSSSEVNVMTNGHPYLTNRILSLMMEARPLDNATSILLRDDSNLRYLGRCLKLADDKAIRLAYKIDEGQTIPCTLGIDDYLDELLVNGFVICNQEGNAVIRCEIYRRFLRMLRDSASWSKHL